VKRALVPLVVVLATLIALPVAVADTELIVQPPAKWRLDREKSAQMNAAGAGAHHFGATPSIDATEAYFPNEIGAALIVTRSTTTTTALPAAARDAAIASAIDELEAWPTRSATTGAPITDNTHERKVLDPDKLLEVTVGGRDAAASTRSMFRMIVAADADKVVTVTGLCLDRDDSNPEHVAACRAALATLSTGIAPAARVALAFPTLVPAAVPSLAPTMDVPSTPAAPPLSAPTLSDGSKIKFAPIEVSPSTTPVDRRPVFIGAGLVVLAAIFWWNRRQRERYSPADKPTPKPPRAGADPDADDLHAAAEEPEKDADAP
jgi:hypothetical protein